MEEIIPKLGDEIPEHWLKKADKEINTQYRSIVLDKYKDKENVEIWIHQPNTKIEGIATDVYSRIIGKLLSDPDMKMRKELLEIYKKRGIWGDEQENKLEEIQEQMRDIEFSTMKMKANGRINKEILDKWRSQWMKLRDEKHDLLNEKTALLTGSIESRAEEEGVKVKLSHCVKYPDGTRVWNTVDEFNDDLDKNAITKILNEALWFWVGLTQEVIASLPNELFSVGEEKNQEIK